MLRRHIIGTPAALGALSLFLIPASCTHPGGEPAGPAATAQATPTIGEALQGMWTGSARSVVQWVQNPQLAVTLNIAPDGAVTGTVGDATLVDASIFAGRGDLLRSLGWGRDFRIHGRLDGDIIKA